MTYQSVGTKFNYFICITPTIYCLLYQAQMSDGKQYLVTSTLYKSVNSTKDYGALDDLDLPNLAFIKHPSGLLIKNFSNDAKVIVPYQKDMPESSFNDRIDLRPIDQSQSAFAKNSYELHCINNDGSYEIGVAVLLHPSQYIDFTL